MEKKIYSFCRIIIKDDGTPCCYYLDAAGLPTWMWTILFKGQSRLAYYVGGEQSLSITQGAEQVAECYSPQTRIEIRHNPDPSMPLEQSIPLTSRASKELGLHQTRQFQDSLLRAIEFNRGWKND